MTAQDRPQDPVPPEYQDAAQGVSEPYQPYPPGYAHSMPYQPYYPPQGPPPPNHLGWAIASILLFWPVGIAAIIKSTQVDRYWMTGQYSLAEQASRSARTLGIVSLAVAGALLLIWLVMFFLLFNTFVDQIPELPAPPR